MWRRFLVPLALACLATATAAAEAEGGGGSSALITPKIGTVFWTVVTFLALAIFLRIVAWNPLLGAIDRRERMIRESQDQARQDREEAAALLEQHRQILGKARQERLEAVEAGRKDAERLKAEILDDARRQREQTLKQTESQVETALRQAQGELRAAAADLAVRAASKLVASSLDESAQRRLVEEYLADLESQAGPSGSLPS
ncbi:MAG: F0F1 ATP synthase subunit B [Acidobacteriia bacterium]|nr:F0F1 ATP synthase subunit B [Terriglobia bacterium]